MKACRGNELDDGLEAAEESDAISEPPPAQRIPLEADFLYAYSTTPGLCRRVTVSVVAVRDANRYNLGVIILQFGPSLCHYA